MDICVECYSGAGYADRPVALTWEGTRHEITSILDSWRSPAGKVFRARTKDGREFELAYDEFTDQWRIEVAQ